MTTRRTLLACFIFGFCRAQLSPWYWATTVVTETVWTICEAEHEPTTIVSIPHCPPTTSIALENAVLTGITVQPASSPTSCYSLPIPTSALEMIALASNQISNSTSDDDPMFFYLGENATVPEYIATVIDGQRCMLDVSPNASVTGRVALILAGGESLVFDETGLHHFDADCNSASSVEISGFLDQIASIAEAPSSSNETGNSLMPPARKRDEDEEDFTVTLQIEKEITGQLKEPHLTFGPSTCYLIEELSDDQWGNFTFNCQYPGANSSQQACEDVISTWIQPADSTAPGTADLTFIPNGNKLMANLPQFLDRAGAPLAKLIPNLTAPLQQGMNWISAAKFAAIDVAQFGGNTMCKLLHVGVQYAIVFTDPLLPTPHTVGVYHSPPVKTIVGTLASHTTPATKDPPRQVQPTVTDFTSVTATSFSIPLIGALTGLLGGLGDGIGGFAQSERVATDEDMDMMTDDMGGMTDNGRGFATPMVTIFAPIEPTGSFPDIGFTLPSGAPSIPGVISSAEPLSTTKVVVLGPSGF